MTRVTMRATDQSSQKFCNDQLKCFLAPKDDQLKCFPAPEGDTHRGVERSDSVSRGTARLVCTNETKMGNGALLGLHEQCEEQGEWYMANPATEDLTDEGEEGESKIQSPPCSPKNFSKGIQIEGAVGIYAQHINSSYFVQNGEMHNKRRLYRSLSNPDHWLRYTTAGKWMVSTTKDKDNNLPKGFCCCKDFGLFDPRDTKGWFVLGRQGMYRRQTKVKATRIVGKQLNYQDSQTLSEDHKKRDDEARLMQDALPSHVKIAGVTGLLASKINGVYKCKTKAHPTKLGERIEDKKIFYRYQAQSCWLYNSILLNDSSGRWIVLRDKRVLAYCELAGLADPCDSKQWCILDSKTSASTFLPQLSVVVTRANAEDMEAQNMLVRSVRRRPSFRLEISTSVGRMLTSSMPTLRKRRNSKFSTGYSIKEVQSTLSPYMKALEKMKERNRQRNE